MNRVCFIAVLVMLINSSCSFRSQANTQFGDQHFKTAISLIELHRTRNGLYPETLKELEFLGSWDLIWVNNVEYKKVSNGYILNLKNGWIGMPDEIQYPENFWKGLGVTESNMMTRRTNEE